MLQNAKHGLLPVMQGRSRTLRHLEQHWLDFGTNKYKPYALQGGATDLHMPFVAQVLSVLIVIFGGSIWLDVFIMTAR